MPGDRFEFVVETSDGSVVGNDNTASPSSTSVPSARDQRQQETHALRQEAAERARQREIDRRMDRKERREKRAASDSEAREARLARLRDQGNRRRIAQERAYIAEQNRGQTLRRRFINNAFGSINQAHLGRRINHGIDFIRSLFGGPQNSRGGELSTSSTSQTSRFGTDTTRQSSSSTRDTVRDVTRDRIRDRILSRRDEGLIARHSRLASRVGGGRATQLLGRRFLANVGAGIGRVVGALGKLGPIGLAVGAGLLAIGGAVITTTGAFVALNRLTGRLIKSLEGIPSPVLFAQLDTQFEILNAKFQRADRLGEGLAAIERVQGKNTAKTFGIVDDLAQPLLPLTEALNRLAGMGLDLLSFAIRIDSKIGFLAKLEQIGIVANAILSLMESWSIGDVGSGILSMINPTLAAVLKAIGFFDDEKDKKNNKDFNGGDIMKDLFKAMNNPVGDIDAPFEFNIGGVNVPNAFDGGI